MMAQTLNPYASAFQPPLRLEEHELELERYLLPDSLLVSPRSTYDSSFTFSSRCSPRGGYSSSHLSDIPYHGDVDFLESARLPSVWEQYRHDRLLQYEMECDRSYRKLAETNPVYEPKPIYRRTERPPVQYRPVERRNQIPPPPATSTHSAPHRRAPIRPRQNPKFSTIAKQRAAPHHPPQKMNSCAPKFSPPTAPPKIVGDVSPKYDAECLLHLVRSQLEFYFSDQNLFEEQHSNLQYYMKLDSQRWVPSHILLNLPSIAKLTTDMQVILDALRSSNLLELNEDESKCRRPNYIPPADYKVRKNLRRSVLVYGLPEQMTDKSIRQLLGSHGNILCVAFAGMEEGPDTEIGAVIMKKKFGEQLTLTNLTTAFVVFESQSQANKCVKTRSRHSVDGIRTMHKYDYNKVVKRLGKGQSPLITPNPSPMMPAPQSSNKKHYGGLTPNQTATKSFQLSPNNNVHKQNVNNPPPHHHHHNNLKPMYSRSAQHGNRMGFRKPASNHWRKAAPAGVSNNGPDSLNWRGDNSMRPRTNSAQNSRSNYGNQGSKYQERRFSKENFNHQNSFALLKTM